MLDQNIKFVHELLIPIRWYDMDAFGHVNTSVYFTYFEQARISWWMELTHAEFKMEDVGPVVVKASCTFHKSVIFPETLSVKVYAGPPGRSSYETFYQICSSKNPDLLYADGYAKIVWVDRKLERSVPLPEKLRTILMEK